jgi:hypothetical protein
MLKSYEYIKANNTPVEERDGESSESIGLESEQKMETPETTLKTPQQQYLTRPRLKLD